MYMSTTPAIFPLLSAKPGGAHALAATASYSTTHARSQPSDGVCWCIMPPPRKPRACTLFASLYSTATARRSNKAHISPEPGLHSYSSNRAPVAALLPSTSPFPAATRCADQCLPLPSRLRLINAGTTALVLAGALGDTSIRAPRPLKSIRAPRPSPVIHAPRPIKSIHAPRPIKSIHAPRPFTVIRASRPLTVIHAPCPLRHWAKTDAAFPSSLGGENPAPSRAKTSLSNG